MGRWTPGIKLEYEKTTDTILLSKSTFSGFINRQISVYLYHDDWEQQPGPEDVGFRFHLRDGSKNYLIYSSPGSGKCNNTYTFRVTQKGNIKDERQMTPEEVLKLYDAFSPELQDFDKVNYRFSHLVDDMRMLFRPESESTSAGPQKPREYTREQNVRRKLKETIERHLSIIKDGVLEPAA